MARTKREQSPIGGYHVLLKSVEPLFPNEESKNVFKELCIRYFPENSLYSLALLPRCVHMVFSDGGRGASGALKPLTTSYARYYNRTLGHTGSLFDGRFRSEAASDNSELADFAVYVDSVYGTDGMFPKDAFFKNVCPGDEYRRRMNGRLKRVCIDAFAEFSDAQIFEIICRINGVSSKNAAAFTEKEKRALVKNASAQKWVSMRRMSEAAGLAATAVREKPRAAKRDKPSDAPAPAAESSRESGGGRKQDLSVWLL